jgi:tRNA 5-methylaminomethyl-2-thiouridine biosynthesis bifunctional protein
MQVLLLEKKMPCSGDSHAAGAFLSPKMSLPSAYKSYLNTAFCYSLSFYQEYFPELLKACGLLKLPLDEEDRERLARYEPFMQVDYKKVKEHYFFPQAALISPCKLIDAMLFDIRLKTAYQIENIAYHDKHWYVDNFKAKNLILATGSAPLVFDLPYLGVKKVGGYRYDVSFDAMQTLQHNIHRELSFSTYHDNRVIIGATHIHTAIDLKEAAYHDSEGLLTKAAQILPLNGLKILETYTGYRASTRDYFPIVGKVIDHTKTLKHYPYIQKGSKVPEKKYHYFPNLYIHTALASRGFVFAPYNAKLLADAIIDKSEIPSTLTTTRLFLKWARRGRID